MKDLFATIPEEIKFEIFSYLKTHEIQKVVNALPSTKYLLGNERLFKKLCFYRAYECTVSNLQLVQYDVVRELNINCVYWIELSSLRNCIAKFVNLETLYAVETKLSLSEEDCIVYLKLPYLTTLAVTHRDLKTEESVNWPQGIKKLYLQINWENYTLLENVVTKFPNLEEVWVIDREEMIPSGDFEDFLHLILDNLPESVQRFTCKFSDGFEPIFNEPFQLVYNSQNYFQYSTCGNFDIKELIQNKETEWSHIFQYYYDTELLFGVKDLEKLASRSVTLKDVKLEELNLSHCKALEKELLDYVTPDLIKNNFCFLKKLSVTDCFLRKEFHDVYDLNKKQTIRIRKRSKLEEIIENCPLIEVLEIWRNFTGSSSWDDGFLKPVQNLKYLKSLTLKNVRFQDKFSLLDICKQCPLTTLKIHLSWSPSIGFCNVLCLCIKKANHLKDFKLDIQDKVVPSETIFAILDLLEAKALERIAISCTGDSLFFDKRKSRKSLLKFLIRNPQLVFLHTDIQDCNGCSIWNVWNITPVIKKKLFNKNPYQIVVLINNFRNYCNSDDIPLFHQKEMVEWNSNVALVDIFNGFSC